MPCLALFNFGEYNYGIKRAEKAVGCELNGKSLSRMGEREGNEGNLGIGERVEGRARW